MEVLFEMKPTSAQAVKLVLALVITVLAFVTGAQAASEFKVLHSFLNKYASAPSSALVADKAGNLYGVAKFNKTNGLDNCGQYGCGGAVFKLTHGSGGTWSYSILHVFRGPDGSVPTGSLILDSSGNLYGTTVDGGAHDYGTVFELHVSAGKWEEKVLYSFAGAPTDLDTPLGALTFDGSGNLYGTASNEATNSLGGIFELKPSGNSWQETVLYNFTGGSDGGNPYTSNVVLDSAGNLYGTTGGGGEYGAGVVFELNPSGGSWTETVLYSFTGGADGGGPASGVIFDAAGNLYGTTVNGGIGSCGGGCGTVFELAPSMGNWTENVLHEFNHPQNNEDGQWPFAGLTFDSAGNLYGAAYQGGTHGKGMVFKLVQSGDEWKQTSLHSFDGKDGQAAYPGVIVNRQGVLYGAATLGGAAGWGVVFSITP
jgi:uncharacterized repeat protein (TIGR03803 family)